MIGLKSCPFCGCEAEIITAESIHGGYLFGIMCKYCGSRGDFHHAEYQAIDAWNSRAERICHDVKPSLSYFKCDSCGMEDMGGTELWIRDGFYRLQKPNYCPNCGAMVVK